MADKSVDRRVLRTKSVLRDALTELMEEMGFEQITICNLTERAGINRGTFYSHYADKNELLKQCEDQLITDLAKVQLRYQGKLPEMLISATEDNEPLPIIIDIYRYLQKNGRFVRALLSDNGDPAFVPRMKEILKDNIVKLILHYDPNAKVNSAIGDYYFAFATEAQLGILKHWLDTGMKESPEEIAVIIRDISLMRPADIGEHLLAVSNKREADA